MTKIEFPRKPAAFLLYFLKSLTTWQKTSIFLLVLITTTVVASNFVMIYGFKLLIDLIPKAKSDEVWNDLFWPFWIIAGCCVFHTIFYRIRDVINAYSTPYVMNALREMLIGNVTRHSHDYFHNRFSGELVNKVNNVIVSYRNILWDRFLHGFIPSISAIVSSFIILWFADSFLALAFITIVFVMFASIYLMQSSIGVAYANLADRESDISGQLVDTITNISSVKNFSQQEHEIALLKRTQLPFVRAYKHAAKWDIIFWGVFDIFICVLVIGSIWYLIENYSKGQLSIGDVAVALLIAWDIWYRMAFLSWNLVALSGDLGKMSSALNDFVRPVNVKDRDGAEIFLPQHGQIEFKNVSFHYDSGHVVFKDFNLSIPSSQKVGIIGLSGAGKTTLCQLLLRNYDIQSGHITVGGFDVAAVTQESLRKNIAVIPQDPSLFHRTLQENILYGRPDATDEEVISASKAAQAHEFILSTPEGYQTMVGERGVKLSGGQRQRIAIARAILKNAPILILDEATSALDSDTELQIQSALNMAMQGRTTLVIAHRLSTLSRLDRIIVMKDGQIIEDGTLNQLIDLGGHFSHLWALQAGGFLPDKIK
jgi:ATP-binding cassette subfamily B protein